MGKKATKTADNSASTKKPRGRPFKSGESGNPGGRPSGYQDIRRAALKLCPKAIEVLADGMDSEDEKIRLTAANGILDRGVGKPAQAITGPEGGPIQVDYTKLSDEQLRQLRAILADAAISSTA